MIPIYVYFKGAANATHILMVIGSQQLESIRKTMAKVPVHMVTEDTIYLTKTRFSAN